SAERSAEPPEEEYLLVRRPRRDDDADAARPVLAGEVAESSRHLADRARPGGWQEFVLAAHQRMREPALTLEVAVGEPAGVAHPVLVHRRVLARLEAEDAALAMVDLDVAAVGARAAHRVGALQVPDTRAEAEVAAGECPDRTDVDDVAGVRIVEHLAGRQLDLAVVAALVDGELARVRHLVQEARAASAEDAPLLVEHDQRPDRDRLLLPDLRRQREAAPLPVVVHVVLLELALAGLVADRAVDRMVDEQELEHRTLCGLRLLVRRMHDHPIGDSRVAGDLQLRVLLDLDQTHAAVARDREAGMPAVVRDLDAEPLGGLDDGQAVGNLGPLAVDLKRGHGGAAARRRAGTGNGRAWRAARTRRGTWWRRRAPAWRRRRTARRSWYPSCYRRC